MTDGRPPRPAPAPALTGALLVCALVAIPAGAAGTGEPPPAVAAAAEPGRHALLIGVDDFEDPAFDSLQWAEADAREMASGLEANGFDSTELITTDGPSSRAGVYAELDRFLASRGPDDTVLVYLSTHGVIDSVGGARRRFLVARDTRRDDLRATGVEVRELLRRVEAAPPRWKVVVLASCFGGAGEGIHSVEGPMPDHRRGRGELPPLFDIGLRATVVLSASHDEGPAWEDPALGHEIYTYYLLEALSNPDADEIDLDGDGALSTLEAHGYAAERTIDHTEGRQLPSVALNSVGERDVLLTGDAPREARRGVFWLLADWLQPRGEAGPQAWIDGEQVAARSRGHALQLGPHVLRLHWPDGSQPDRKLPFRVGRGDDLSVSDVVARADDQWLGLEGGAIFVAGPGSLDTTSADGHRAPPAVPALRLVFEQRILGRSQPRGLNLGIALAWWPGHTYDDPLGRLPARYASADVALLGARRSGRLSLGFGPFAELSYLRAADTDASVIGMAPGLRLRLHVRIWRRLSLRANGQLSLALIEPFTGGSDPEFVLFPSLTLGLGVGL